MYQMRCYLGVNYIEFPSGKVILHSGIGIFRTSFRSLIGSTRELRIRSDNCSAWNCVPHLFGIFKNKQNHQTLLNNMFVYAMFFGNIHVGPPKKNACGKPETLQAGNGGTNPYKNVTGTI